MIWENCSVTGLTLGLCKPLLKESRQPSNGEDTENSTKGVGISEWLRTMGLFISFLISFPNNQYQS